MQYQTRFAFPRLTPFIKKLVIVLLSTYVIELILQNFVGIPIFGILALNTDNMGIETLWQLFTYVLVDHPSAPLSLLFGLLFIWLIVSPFEISFGEKRTMQLCAVAVLAASLAAVGVGILFSGMFSEPSLLFGAHPIAYAGMAAMATTVRNRYLSFFGLFTMTANQLLLLLVGLSLLMFLATKNLAMLVGSLAAIGSGIWFVHWMSRPRKKPGSKNLSSRFKVIKGGMSDTNDPPKWLN